MNRRNPPPPRSKMQADMEAWYQARLAEQGLTCSWLRNAAGRYVAAYAQDAWDAWQSAAQRHRLPREASDVALRAVLTTPAPDSAGDSQRRTLVRTVRGSDALRSGPLMRDHVHAVLEDMRLRRLLPGPDDRAGSQAAAVMRVAELVTEIDILCERHGLDRRDWIVDGADTAEASSEGAAG